jgi:hypothetical protein
MSTLKVTYLTLPHQAGDMLLNVGDRVIYRGVRNIMRRALGPHAEEVRFMSDHEPFPADTDVLVVCGTPQILHGAATTRNIDRILEAAGSDIPVKINIGAGSFYFDAFDGNRRELDASFAERVSRSPIAKAYALYSGFDLCTCRDYGAEAVLRAVGVDVVPLPCPGFFSALFESRPLFRRQQQVVSVLNGTASFWNRVSGDVHDFYRRLWEADPSRIFLAHDEQDCTMLADLGIPYVTFGDADDLISYLAASERLLSLRVHGALPAWTLGLDVTLLGIDRRALLGDDFGARFRVIPLRTEEDFRRAEVVPIMPGPQQSDAERRHWLQHNLDLYVKNIRQVISHKLGRSLPDGVPLHGGGDPDPHVPAITAPAGRYFQSFFYNNHSQFAIHPDELRSAHGREVVRNDTLVVTRTGSGSTLIFGPYILVPKGSWLLTGTVTLEFPEDQAPDALENRQLIVRVTKGVPGLNLAREAFALSDDANGRKHALSMAFDNQSDTGAIETVFSSNQPLPEGTRLIIEGLRLTMQLTVPA